MELSRWESRLVTCAYAYRRMLSMRGEEGADNETKAEHVDTLMRIKTDKAQEFLAIAQCLPAVLRLIVLVAGLLGAQFPKITIPANPRVFF